MGNPERTSRSGSIPPPRPSAQFPAADLRVADFSGNLAGPFCGQILADMGARVVKVERPGVGDPARAWAPPDWGGDGTLFLASNRGKRSLALDLARPEGQEVAERLVDDSHVVIQAFRPDVAERFGLTETALRPGRPRLVICTITAYGSSGANSARPGYDPLLQAEMGLMSLTGPSGGPPVRVGTSVVDLGAGIWAALGILAAVRARDATGEGTHLEVSLQDTALNWVGYHLQGVLASGHVPGPMGSGLPMICPYGAFPTRDGSLMVAAGNDALFQKLCDALQVADVAEDPRFTTNPLRVAHRQDLEDLLKETTATITTQELARRLESHGVPFAPVRDLGEVSRDPGVLDGAFRLEPHPRIPGYRALAIPPVLGGFRGAEATPPPQVGEHSEEVLAELGYSPQEVEILRNNGITG